ncbi:family 20 glycosylhydrolase [Thalassotalea hakodatensis]|uniref:family 20 glycosylhydrolase n=1 Tax=Thalassotalea hakodatensis TaxID=3030492 RepID=UPI002573BC33|nr:family 20 glycosylhydrolase [Thalassotalea hakodatensis]
MMKKNDFAALATAVVMLLGCGNPQAPSTQDEQPSETKMQQTHSLTQQQLDNIATSLQVTFVLVTNQAGDKCDKNKTDGLCFEAQFQLTATEDLPAAGWSIYYSQIAPLHNFDGELFTLEHLNGDLHRLTPTDKFTGINKGESETITFRASFWTLAESDIMPNMIISAPDLAPKVIESTKTGIDSETKMEVLKHVKSYSDYQHHFQRTPSDKTQWLTAEDFYQRNKVLGEKLLDVSKVIIPTPKNIVFPEPSGVLELTSGLTVDYGNVPSESVAAALHRLTLLGVEQATNGVKVKLSIVPDPEKMIGSYTLTALNTGIRITGVDEAGVFNGLQSLASLLTVNEPRIPYVSIQDEPLFEFRGLLVDVARNFRDKNFIIKLMDQMAAYKLNKLHLHMGEDEGWRLEIPGLPELTEVSGKRCFDVTEQKCLMPQLGAGVDENNKNNGFYSVDDYTEILKAATARHIQVLPSLDMPGHSRAAIKAMTARYNKYMQLEDKAKAEQYLLHDPNDITKYSSVQFYNDNTINACQESSYAFVEKVMTEVKNIHQAAGQPLTRYHIGADETAGAWLESPVCKAFIENNDKGVTDMKQLGAYFVERVANMISDMGIEPAAWSDGLEHVNKENMPAVVQANSWGHIPWGAHHVVNKFVNQNWQVVMSTPDVTYFDFPYEADPKEHGYYWASRHTNTEKVFQFMPQNLPVHAEFWLDRQDNPFSIDDTLQKDEQGNVINRPMKQGRNVLGIQGQLWSENVRTDNVAEYKIFPRLIALAERAWYEPEWVVTYNYQGAKYSQSTNAFTAEKEALRNEKWRVFANALGQKELPKLDLARVTYRLPTAGAQIKQGKLYANSAFPGLTIEYKEKNKNWITYQKPIAVSNDVAIRTSTQEGDRKSRITKVRFQP